MEHKPREGELYRRVSVCGKTFVLYYGYYEPFEREYGDPIPIYPDFLAAPLYTDDGHPLATQMQDMCDLGMLRAPCLQDRCCGNCVHFSPHEDLFGICTCQDRRKP